MDDGDGEVPLVPVLGAGAEPPGAEPLEPLEPVPVGTAGEVALPAGMVLDLLSPGFVLAIPVGGGTFLLEVAVAVCDADEPDDEEGPTGVFLQVRSY